MTTQEANLRHILRRAPMLLDGIVTRLEEMVLDLEIHGRNSDVPLAKQCLKDIREVQHEIGSLNLPATRVQYPPRDIGATSIQKGGQAGWPDPDIIDPAAM